MAPFSYARRAILWRHNMVSFNGAILWHVCTRLKISQNVISTNYTLVDSIY